MTDWETCPAVERDPGKCGWGLGLSRHPCAGQRVIRESQRRGDAGPVPRVVPRRSERTSCCRPGACGPVADSGQPGMKVLFDQGTPVPLRRSLPGHAVDTAFERGWGTLRNGDLLNRAEAAGYDLLITTDQQLPHQQNLSGRRLAILVLRSTSWPRIQAHVRTIRERIGRMQPGEYQELAI